LDILRNGCTTSLDLTSSRPVVTPEPGLDIRLYVRTLGCGLFRLGYRLRLEIIEFGWLYRSLWSFRDQIFRSGGLRGRFEPLEEGLVR
jgi:hypothetical protein